MYITIIWEKKTLISNKNVTTEIWPTSSILNNILSFKRTYDLPAKYANGTAFERPLLDAHTNSACGSLIDNRVVDMGICDTFGMCKWLRGNHYLWVGAESATRDVW